MDDVLKNLEEHLADYDQREALVERAKLIIGACSRIMVVRTLEAKRAQKEKGVDDNNAPEITELKAEMLRFHKDLEAIEGRFDVDAFRRTFTEHRDFSDKYAREVVEYNAKTKTIIRSDIANLNGGPK